MPRPVSPSIPEKEFLISALQESLRLDGRATTASREPQITFGPELGWVEVAMGKTRFVRDYTRLLGHRMTRYFYMDTLRDEG